MPQETEPTKVFDSVDAMESFSLLSDKSREMVRDDARATLLIKDPTGASVAEDVINVLAISLLQYGWTTDNRFTFNSNEVQA